VVDILQTVRPGTITVPVWRLRSASRYIRVTLLYLVFASAKEVMLSLFFVCICLPVSNFAQKLSIWFAWIFREGWQWANEQTIKFWWRSGSPSGYRDCFSDSSLMGDKESGINRLCCVTLQCIAIATTTSIRHRPLAEVGICTVAVLLVLEI